MIYLFAGNQFAHQWQSFSISIFLNGSTATTGYLDIWFNAAYGTSKFMRFHRMPFFVLSSRIKTLRRIGAKKKKKNNKYPTVATAAIPFDANIEQLHEHIYIARYMARILSHRK